MSGSENKPELVMAEGKQQPRSQQVSPEIGEIVNGWQPASWFASP